MHSLLVVIRNVVAEETPQLTLVDHDDMVEQLTADGFDPALSDPVLPRASICGSNWIDAEVLDRVGDPR